MPELLSSKIKPCHLCKGTGKGRTGTSGDCAGCGGTGYRRQCNDIDCMEYGCGGYGYCYAEAPEITRLRDEVERLQEALKDSTAYLAWVWENAADMIVNKFGTQSISGFYDQVETNRAALKGDTE